jgi:hypothetical protein
MTAWKNTERAIASIVGGKRVPITGRQRGDVPDIDHDNYSIEVKHRKKLPSWIQDAMDQAIQSSRGNKAPIVILHEHGKRHDNDYVIISLKNFNLLRAL